MMYNQCDNRAPHELHPWQKEGAHIAHYMCRGVRHQPLNQLDLEGENTGRTVD